MRVFSPTVSRILKAQFGEGIVVRQSKRHHAVLVIAPTHMWKDVSKFLHERGYVTGDSVSLFNGDRALTVTSKEPVDKLDSPKGKNSITRFINKQMPEMFKTHVHTGTSVLVTASSTCSDASIKLMKHLIAQQGYAIKRSIGTRSFIVELPT